MAHGAEAVVGLDGLHELLGIHAGGLGKALERVGLEGPAALDRISPFLLEVRELRADGNHHTDTEINALVLFHVVERGLIVHDVHRAADAFESIARKRPLKHDLLVAEALAPGREPQVRLLGGCGDVVRRADPAGTRAIGGLNLAAFLAAAGGPGHLDAVAGLALLGEAVGIREAQVLLAHFLVVEEAARGDDRGLRIDGDLVAVLVRRDDALHGAVLVLDELLAPGVEQQRLARILVLLLEEIDPAGTSALIDVPSVEAVGIVGEELLELHAVGLHPVNGLPRLVDEGAHHLGVSAPMTVVHDLLEGLVLCESVVPVALHGALDGEDAFGELASAADHRLLFERDDLEALFGSGPACGGARCTRAHDDNIDVVGGIDGEGGRHGGCDGRCRHRAKKLVHSYLLFMVVTRPVRGSLLRSVCRRQGRLSVVTPTHEGFHSRALSQNFRQSPVTTPSMLKSSLSVISVTG